MAHSGKPRNHTTRRGRLEGYDYRLPGYFFLTICVCNRASLFGRIDNRVMEYSPAGTMLVTAIEDLERRYQQVTVDAFVIMPNHVHLLLGNLIRSVEHDFSASIPTMMDWWKTVTTKRYINGVRDADWPAFKGKLWQSGYHDRIVRDERELEIIRRYIAENPQRWKDDTVLAGN